MSSIPKRLDGKRCLITGGSRGLGRAMVEHFVSQGAKVVFTYSRNDADADAVKSAVTANGGEVFAMKGSCADANHVKDVMNWITAQWNGIDVLINNAGTTQVLPIGLLDEDDWDRVMDVNVKGAYLFGRAALRPMIRAKAGAILNIGSFASERVVEAPVHYAAAKAALRGFTEALAREVGRYNVRVNLLSPGLLNVGLAQTLPKHRLAEYTKQSASGRLGRADEIAAIAAFMVSDDNTFMTGAKLVADGGL
jgi:3-oxoacyl-[acyl-carrier protein] reductase